MDERVSIEAEARALVQRYAALIEQITVMLGSRLRGEPVLAVRIERGDTAEDVDGESIVIRVLVDGEIEEAQHIWERIEHDLGDLQFRVPPDQRRMLADQVSVVLNWSGGAVER